MKEPDSFILGLLEIVLKQSLKNNLGMIDFVDWFKNNQEKLSVVLPDGMEAVNVLTIHKSKGLQFPIVIIPELSWDTSLRNDFLWVNIEKGFFNEIEALVVSKNKKLKQTFLSAQYDNENDKNSLDHLNLMYVAFTRAEERLYGLLKMPSEKKDSEKFSIEKLILDFTSQNNFTSTGANIFSFGNRNDNLSNIKPLEVQKFTSLNSSNWLEKFSISNSNLLNNENESLSVEKGIAVHKVLEKINSKSDLEKLETLLHNENVLLQDINFYKKEIEFLVSESELSYLFNNNLEVYNEFEIFTIGGILRPDKLIKLNEEFYVIDFKTGKKNKNFIEKQKTYAESLIQLQLKVNSTYIYYFADRQIDKLKYA
jgi:ATP-dependent exoDNAse (exonuclease V) beta subunit